MEIKMRAWHPDISKMIYSNGWTYYEKNEFYPICFPVGFRSYPHHGWEIMLYTGWKDANQKSLYVGDKIEIGWQNGETTCEVISYDEYYGYFKYGNNPLCELKDPIRSFVIVGNIYEEQAL